jgi:cytochrome bd-type quinol oxidase subunit 1
MDLTALLLSRIQFAFTVSFHIIFPSFTIGLAAWLTVLEALHLATGRPAYRDVFEFWLKIFGVAFGLGVVSGIVMGFQFGTNWSVLAKASGPIQGPLLAYETFTAFFLEASFFGILLFGRPRVAPWFYLFSTAMVGLGTTLSAFWIMVNNSWMQVPSGRCTRQRWPGCSTSTPGSRRCSMTTTAPSAARQAISGRNANEACDALSVLLLTAVWIGRPVTTQVPGFRRPSAPSAGEPRWGRTRDPDEG